MTDQEMLDSRTKAEKNELKAERGRQERASDSNPHLQEQYRLDERGEF
jgi:hypothetical protein